MGAAAADMDNDGDPDLLIAGDGRNWIFENNGDTTFKDVSSLTPGIEQDDGAGVHVFVFDADNDGLLDVYFTSWLKNEKLKNLFRGSPLNTGTTTLNRLYLNRGRMKFEPVFDYNPDINKPDDSDHWKWTNPGFSWAAGLFDLEGDGRPEIYLGNDYDMYNLILRSPEDKYLEAYMSDELLQLDFNIFHDPGFTFTDIAPEKMDFYKFSKRPNFHTDNATMGIGTGDADNDGDVDIYLTEYGANVFGKNYGGYLVDIAPENNTESKLLSESLLTAGKVGRDCRGIFFVGWSAEFYDYDRDGLLDLFLLNGNVIPGDCYQPDQVFHNDGDLMFTDISSVTVDNRKEPPVYFWPSKPSTEQGRGMAWADYDRDGDDDVIISNGNGDPVRVYRNDIDSGNNYIRVHLTGTSSNRNAIGSVILAIVGDIKYRREVNLGGNVHTSNSLTEEIGTGASKSVDKLEIWWPSGYRQTIEGPMNAGTTIEVTEPELVKIEKNKNINEQYTITVFPRNPNGTPDTSAKIKIESPHIMWKSDLKKKEGFSRNFTITNTKKYARFKISIDGKELNLRPVIRID